MKKSRFTEHQIVSILNADPMVRDAPVIDAINGNLEDHPRRSFWKCYKRLRNIDREWNHKRIDRGYCAMGLNQPPVNPAAPADA